MLDVTLITGASPLAPQTWRVAGVPAPAAVTWNGAGAPLDAAIYVECHVSGGGAGEAPHLAAIICKEGERLGGNDSVQG